MAASKYDLSKNVDAVTHFLDIVNGSEGEESQGQSAGLSESVSNAAIEVVRRLREVDPVPLEDLIETSEFSTIEISQAIAHLAKVGAIQERTLPGDIEALSLTDDGRRLASIVEKTPLAS